MYIRSELKGSDFNLKQSIIISSITVIFILFFNILNLDNWFDFTFHNVIYYFLCTINITTVIIADIVKLFLPLFDKDRKSVV